MLLFVEDCLDVSLYRCPSVGGSANSQSRLSKSSSSSSAHSHRFCWRRQSHVNKQFTIHSAKLKRYKIAHVFLVYGTLSLTHTRCMCVESYMYTLLRVWLVLPKFRPCD